MKSIRYRVLWLGSLFAGSCATPGAGPHDMGVAEHEAAAQSAEEAAGEHQEQFDPGATASQTGCRGNTTSYGGACWTSTRNPTDAHRRAAENYRKQAADHRAASAALRDAEARACVGLPPEDRDMSPFDHTEDIASVVPLVEKGVAGKTSYEKKVGATVTFRAVEGMTAEWLQRLVDCHLARNAALGHVVPEMPNCPLVPKGAEAHVSSTGAGFAVAIRSDDRAAADEILARAQRLLPLGPVSSTP